LTGWVIRCIHAQEVFPNSDAVSQNDNAPIRTAVTVQLWFEEHEGEFQRLPCPAQLPDLNIIEPLWSILETRVRNRFPTPTSIKQLEDVLQEVWYKISLQTVQNLYDFVPKRTTDVLQAKDDPSPYY
jgi:hypothetical protein